MLVQFYYLPLEEMSFSEPSYFPPVASETNQFLQVWLICGLSYLALPSLLFRTE